MECGDIAAATVASTHEQSVLQVQLTEGAPDSNCTQSFGPVEGTKVVLLEPNGDTAKVARVGMSLTPK